LDADAEGWTAMYLKVSICNLLTVSAVVILMCNLCFADDWICAVK